MKNERDMYHSDQVELTKDLFPLNTNLPQGRINRTSVWRNTAGEKFVLRQRSMDPHFLARFQKELTFVEFLPQGSFSIRSTQEEFAAMNAHHELGLAVPKPIDANEKQILLPFILGSDLRCVLQSGHFTGIHAALLDILHAHSIGVVYGDRWAKNIILHEETENQSQARISQIDFDLAISGPKSRELEITQFLYSILCCAESPFLAAQCIRDILPNKALFAYEKATITNFMARYASKYTHEDQTRVKALKSAVAGTLSHITAHR